MRTMVDLDPVQDLDRQAVVVCSVSEDNTQLVLAADSLLENEEINNGLKYNTLIL